MREPISINWHEVPFVRLVTPLIVGIIVGQHITFTLNVLIFSILTFGAATYFFKKKFKRPLFVLINGAMSQCLYFLLGLFLVVVHDDTLRSNFLSYRLANQKEVVITGIVDELPEDGKNKKITVKVAHVNDSSATGKILVYLKPSVVANNVAYGDEVVFKAYINPIRKSKNPETFDFQQYMKHHKVFYLSYVKEEDFTVVGHRKGNFLLHWAYDCQEKLTEILAIYLTEQAEFSVGAALIIGYRSAIPDEIVDTYVNTGALHVLSVSGLHVGLVSMIFDRIIKRFRYKSSKKFWRWLDPLLQIIGIWSFSLISGGAPCVLRAAVMFSFLVLGKTISKSASIYNMLAASCFFLLLWNPNYLFDVGFQLSYVGLVGIVYFQPKIYVWGLERMENSNFWSFIYHYHPFDFKIKTKWLRNIIFFPVADYCWQLTAVSISATIAVTPLSIYYFHQFPTYFWLSGLIVVPLAGWALYAGLLLFMVHFVSSFLAAWIGKLLWLIIWLLNGSLYWIDKIPPGAIKHLWWSGLTTILLYIALGFFVKAFNAMRTSWIAYGVMIVGMLLSMRFAYVNIANQRDKELIIYNTGFYTMIDCFTNGKNICIATKDIPERTINFAAYGHRLTKNILPDEVQMVALEDSIAQNDIFFNKNLLIFNQTKILLLDKAITEKPTEKIKVDYVLIKENPTLTMSDINSTIDCKMIIFDASNKHYIVEKWKSECEQLGVQYHDVSQKYFQVKIE
jgi:competence protein ComEC